MIDALYTLETRYITMATGTYPPRRRKRRRQNTSIIWFILFNILLLAGLVFLILWGFDLMPGKDPADPTTTGSTVSTQANTQPPETTVPPTTEPTPTEPHVVSTASIGVTGDIMGHMPVINAGLTDNGYDFNNIFTYVKPYYEKFDLMIANLEVNLGGPEAGPYQGYPTFNCPDDMAVALKNAGVDMVLTANNHTYDVGHDGFVRTQQVLDDLGIDHLGTVTSAETPLYQVRDINGIKVGMVCYTYETGDPANPRTQLNGIAMTVEDSPLVGSFNYNDLDGFYAELQQAMDAMEAEGAQATMVYIHWGDEYVLKPNNRQVTIAKQLCEMGVDVIVGGHPHVIEPFETLTSSTGHTTYCIYSTGNAISNQRKETVANLTINSNYTEDGMVFSVVFEKWSDGTVKIGEIDILPTWVNKEFKNGKNNYTIIPLDASLSNWDGFDVGIVANTYNSYARTMSIVGNGLNACREALGLPAVPLTKTAE